MTSKRKVICLRGDDCCIIDEQLVAAEAITPGHLIEVNAGKYRKHASASGAGAAIFADYRGEMGKSIDTDYAINDRVKAIFAGQGCRINAIVASGDTITMGQELESDGAGRLKVGTTKPIARAAEDHSPESATISRLAVIII